MMDLFWIVLLGAIAAWVISRPLFRGPAGTAEDPEVAALEAARDAKYREIKDTEIDYRAGKLTRDEFERMDRELRRDAVNILNRLERAHGGERSPLNPPPRPTS